MQVNFSINVIEAVVILVTLAIIYLVIKSLQIAMAREAIKNYNDSMKSFSRKKKDDKDEWE